MPARSQSCSSQPEQAKAPFTPKLSRFKASSPLGFKIFSARAKKGLKEEQGEPMNIWIPSLAEQSAVPKSGEPQNPPGDPKSVMEFLLLYRIKMQVFHPAWLGHQVLPVDLQDLSWRRTQHFYLSSPNTASRAEIFGRTSHPCKRVPLKRSFYFPFELFSFSGNVS